MPSTQGEPYQGAVARALAAKELSYSPYSKFRVGCCILTASGEYIVGANVENASYPAGICAERTAVVKAVTAGHTNWVCIALSGDSSDVVTPCGICRQVLREFVDPKKLTVIMMNADGSKVLQRTLEELLPYSFGPDSLR
ncbi:AGL123Wp [Eremothecium gossypii ATCC 10895]|uniref:Cytidine deaminase n=1 Tax=Eremothecium gossypii (strain ATCC 10895 / CBS 109.51 / FGSC 9923 / NRRL Y-1056) TaxID=284811 RepID=Q750R5_EREGS|nr:AGL123Wp [Eremothecium gossypii ATCC 10895]AAS54368.1 AGL123Wp [Eremothecium gossypii ATCC 10895]AEY98695.1 FAGL123Wp [Eremothecium gossypii FDAG1]